MVFFYRWCLNHQFTPPPQGKEENESIFLNVYIGNTGEILKYKQDEYRKGNDVINTTPLGMEIER